MTNIVSCYTLTKVRYNQRRLDMGQYHIYSRPGKKLCVQFGSFLLLVSFLSGAMFYKYTDDCLIGKMNVGKQSTVSLQRSTLYNDSNTTHYNIVFRYYLDRDSHSDQEYRARVITYQDVCHTRNGEIQARNKIFYYKNPGNNRSLGYCHVPKAGCTFWQKIFQFLNRTSESRRVSNPFDLTRYDVYAHALVPLQKTRYNSDLLSVALRFVFVRNPYSRLMSAYTDKFLLPEFLKWRSYGRKLVKHKRIDDKKPCINNFTLSAFVNRIVLSRDINPHWAPLHQVCDPCKLLPHVIGKQETFIQDVNYVLNKVGLQHLMENYNYKTYVTDHIKQMVEYIYAIRNGYGDLRQCFTDIDIAMRLWRAFQMNGYIPFDMAFPKRQIESLLENEQNLTRVTDIVTDVTVRENTRTGMSRDQHSKQKRDMLVQEFATLSKDTMEKLADKYDIDFRMFGYEKYPKDLFPLRYLKERKETVWEQRRGKLP